jgi:hypothetical protein
MKGLRSFVGLLVILLALGGYLYFVESKREAESEDGKEKVFSVESDKIDELTVKSESGDQTTLKKTGTDWQIVQPAAFQPDSAEVSNITTNLASLERQRVIDENPADIAEYGLAKPRIEIGVKSAGQEKKLLIGRKTPPGTDLYAKLADSPRVFLISSFLDSTFNKTTFDLRDKTVLKLDRDKIDALTITVPAHTVRVAKRDGEWRLAAPLDARADFTTVDGLVSRINGVQMKSIASAEPAGLAEYGLDKPAATLVVLAGDAADRDAGRPRPRVREGPGTSDGDAARFVVPRRAEERARRLPAERSVRCARLQRDRPRDCQEGPDARVREDEGEEQGRAGRGEMAPDRAVGAGRRSAEDRQPPFGGHAVACGKLRQCDGLNGEDRPRHP